MTLGLEISFHDDCDKKAENCQRPRFWDCARIDGFISLSDAATRTFDVVEVVLEGSHIAVYQTIVETLTLL